MAVKKLPSGDWQIDYRVKGVRRRESGFRNKSQAERCLAIRKAEILQSHYHMSSNWANTVYLEELGDAYLELHSKQRNKSWKTDQRRLRYLYEFFGKRKVTSISALDVERFKVTLRKKVSGATVNRHLALMSAMYNWAIRMGQIGGSEIRSHWSFVTNNPVKWIKRNKEKPRNRILWPEEERQLKQVCLNSKDPRIKNLWDLIQFALNTGMRKEEQLSLEWSSIDLQRRIITLKDTKNGEGRIIPINDITQEILNRWKLRSEANQQNKYVFISPRGQRYISIHKGFGKALKKAGIDELRWHDLRGTFCTRLDMLGVGDKVKQEIMGHKTAWMTNRYTHPSPGYKLDAVQRLCENQSQASEK